MAGNGQRVTLQETIFRLKEVSRSLFANFVGSLGVLATSLFVSGRKICDIANFAIIMVARAKLFSTCPVLANLEKEFGI